MRTYYITGDLRIRRLGGRATGPLFVGGPGAPASYIDRLVLRDSLGRALLPGTSLCGVMASLARASLRAAGWPEPAEHPAFVALFGSSRGGATGGQESRLSVSDAVACQDCGTRVRDRNAVDRKRGGAADKHLFNEEVLDGAWSFPLRLEFTETGPRTAAERNAIADPDASAFRLLLDILSLLEADGGHIGGHAGVGYGRFRLDNCGVAARDRCSPEQVLAYTTDRWQAQDGEGEPLFSLRSLSGVLGVSSPLHAGPQQGSGERIRLHCILRPLEPLLVKTGYTTETVVNAGSKKEAGNPLQLGWPPAPQPFAVDAGFCLDADGTPYLPGSSLRGTLRSRAERAVRTVVGRRLGNQGGDGAAWDIDLARQKGQQFSGLRAYRESDVECLVSQIFGFSALGGRISFSDAVPLQRDEFERRRKLLDHVALDRFTGGAASQRKFNSRPYHPPLPADQLGADEGGDLECEIELRDFEQWHLGMLLLLLRDLRNGLVTLGHGKNKGFGRVRLESVSLDVLTGKDGMLAGGLPPDALTLGGFRSYSVPLLFNQAGYLLRADGDELSGVFRQAEQAFRDRMRNWQPVDKIDEKEATP